MSSLCLTSLTETHKLTHKNRARPTNQLPQTYNSELVKLSCFTQTRIRWAVRSLSSKRGKNICSRTSVSSHRSWLEPMWLTALFDQVITQTQNESWRPEAWGREQGTFRVGENNSPSNFSVRHICRTRNSRPCSTPSLSLLLEGFFLPQRTFGGLAQLDFWHFGHYINYCYGFKWKRVYLCFCFTLKSYV